MNDVNVMEWLVDQFEDQVKKAMSNDVKKEFDELELINKYVVVKGAINRGLELAYKEMI